MAYHNLLIWQYRNKPKAVETIELLERILAQGFSDLHQVQDALNIETSIGKNLDLVGKHVGQGRVINHYVLRKFFGFRGSRHALNFSRLRGSGGEWYRKRDPVSESARLNDEDYRFLIKCRIIKNYQTGTLPNIIEACRFIFGGGVTVIDNYDMSVTIKVRNSSLNTFKRFAINNLDILPRQIGVKLIYEIK